MYSLLDRILYKLATDTLFTPFGLRINKLGEEKRGKSDHLDNFENYTFIINLKVFFLANFGFYTL